MVVPANTLTVDPVAGCSQRATIRRYEISVGSWLTVNSTWWWWDSFSLWHMPVIWHRLKSTSLRNAKRLSPISITVGIQSASRPFASYTPSGNRSSRLSRLALRTMALFQGSVAILSNVICSASVWHTVCSYFYQQLCWGACHLTPRMNPWVQAGWRQAPAILHHKEGCLESVPYSCWEFFWCESSWILLIL